MAGLRARRINYLLIIIGIVSSGLTFCKLALAGTPILIISLASFFYKFRFIKQMKVGSLGASQHPYCIVCQLWKSLVSIMI